MFRWDLPGGKAIRKLTLPPPIHGVGGDAAIQELLNDCAPATFGKKGEEVLDESYRKAVNLDSDQFSTNFNPYDAGIVDAITQTLLPGIAKPFSDGETQFIDHLGVVAELYKLNVSDPHQSWSPCSHRSCISIHHVKKSRPDLFCTSWQISPSRRHTPLSKSVRLPCCQFNPSLSWRRAASKA